jgi:predicted metalloprotease with PDZ domain
MRYLLENYANKGVGFADDGFLQAIEAVTGSDFDEFYQMAAQSREELNYNRYLQQAGLMVEVSKQPATMYLGIQFDQGDGGLPRITRVMPNSPAERSRLDVGDHMVSINDARLTFENFRSRLRTHTIGETIKRTVLRGERLVTLNVTPVEFQEERWQIIDAPRAAPEQIQIKNALLGTK